MVWYKFHFNPILQSNSLSNSRALFVPEWEYLIPHVLTPDTNLAFNINSKRFPPSKKKLKTVRTLQLKLVMENKKSGIIDNI
jgi:hypothetical protein